MKKGILALLLIAFFQVKAAVNTQLEANLKGYIDGKDARIGVAVISGTDTVSVNGHEPFPMMSVYKFPIALAVADRCRAMELSFAESLHVTGKNLNPDTYSPMLKKYGDIGADGAEISLRELLKYALQESDNNASDILLDWAGGAEKVDCYISGLGADGISVKWSEDEMYEDHDRSYGNSSTPMAMASLMNLFIGMPEDSLTAELRQIMETCATGTARLVKPLVNSDAVVGHKTGTGFTLPDGRLMAINDAGYVILPDGRRYCIAVFVADSGYTPAETEALIAGISEIVLRHYSFVNR